MTAKGKKRFTEYGRHKGFYDKIHISFLCKTEAFLSSVIIKKNIKMKYLPGNCIGPDEYG